MSIFKDWYEENSDYQLNRKILYLFSPKGWSRLRRHRVQRANRGWSDRDCWNAGDHIAKMTAEMLQHLQDKSYVDWPEWFKMNVKEKDGYKNLQSVIDDINNYAAFQWTSWGDDLTTSSKSFLDDNDEYVGPDWIDKKGKKLTSRQVTARIDKWSKEERRLYEKATNAMQFFGRHFSSFWD